MSKPYIAATVGILYAVLIVALIAGKLAGHFHQSWWLILSPVWGPLVLVAIIVIIVLALFSKDISSGGNPFQ